MAPGRSKNKRIPRPSADQLRSQPTRQTQDLYNAFRRLEDRQAETPCPSPISSVTRATGDMELDDERPPTKKQKAQRQGPLDAVKRARAAFMRVIGACTDCKNRKVVCGHFDRTIFEREYQALPRSFGRTLQVGQTRRAPTPSESMPPSRSWATISQSHYGDVPTEGPQTPLGPVPDQAPNGLVHTGSWHTTHHVENWKENIGDLGESLFGGAPSTLPTTGFRLTLGIPESAPLFTHERPTSQLPAAWTSQRESLGFGIQNFVGHNAGRDDPLERNDGDIVAIARKLGVSSWQCKHGVDAIPSPGVEARGCGEVFPLLADAIAHFATRHAPILEDWSTWKCRSATLVSERVVLCDSLVLAEWGDPSGGKCQACGGCTWQFWQYGLVSKRPVSTQDATARVLSRDGASLGGTFGSLSQSLSHGFLDPATSSSFWPGRDMASGYCGSQRSQSSLQAIADGFRLWSKQRVLSPQRGPVAPLLFLLCLFPNAFLCLLRQTSKLASSQMETGRDAIFWGSLCYLVAGGLVTWLAKSIQSRLGRPMMNAIVVDTSRYQAVPLRPRAVDEGVC